MIRARRAKPQRPMWPPAVVVGAVPGKNGLQVSLAEDQDAVGEFGSGCADESFGEAVCSRTARWDLQGVDVGAGQDRVERCGELASAIADEESEGGGAAVGVYQQVAGLLGGPGPGRVAGRTEDVHVVAADFQGEEDVDPVGAENPVTSCDVEVLVQNASEPVAS